MDSIGTPQPQICKNCPEPVAEGSIGLSSDMCLSCTRASYRELQQQAASTQDNSSEINEPEPETNPLPQSGTEQVAGVDKGTEDNDIKDKDDGTKYAEDSKEVVVTGTDVPAEEDSPPSNSHKRHRPTASKNSDATKLTPACANCKRAKVRCTHRLVLNEDSTPADDQTPPRAQKKAVRLRVNHPETDGTTESDPNASRRTRGGSRKRRLAGTEEEDSQSVFELPDDGTRDESQQPPVKKRARRGRKPRSYNQEVVEEIDGSSDTAQAAAEEPPAAATGTGVFRVAMPPFPAGNLQGSTVLARHVVLSRELQQKIDVSHARWIAAMEALQETKRTLDTWVDVWTRGE